MAHFFMVVQTSSHNKHVNEDTSLTLKNRKTVYLINFRSQKELTQVLKIEVKNVKNPTDLGSPKFKSP